MELPTYKFIPHYAALSRVEMYSDDRIVDILNRLEAIGFSLEEPHSPLEDLTLRELDILSRATNGID